MRKSAYDMGKKSKTETDRLKVSQNPLDDNLSKYNELNQEINKIIRTINIQFDFKNFKKEKLQSLEVVSTTFYLIINSILIN